MRIILIAIVLIYSSLVFSANVAPDFPDPMILKTSDGYYYAYATGLKVTRSKDLTHWEKPWDPMPQKPIWANRWNKFWAPHVLEHKKKFYLYYSAQPNWSENEMMRLGVAVANSPDGPFKDIGHHLDTGDAEENIDSMVFKEGDKFYLYWGRNGIISVQELSPDLLSFKPDSKHKEILHPGKREYEEIIEAPYVFKKKKYYYLFYSGDDCCTNPHYAVSVARSTSPFGPFEKFDSYSLLGTSRWHSPGHNGIFLKTNKDPMMVYHVIDKKYERNSETGHIHRLMKISPLRFQQGRPGSKIEEALPLKFLK